MHTIKRVFIPPASSYFLFGPRGTGKSTFLQQHYKTARWVNLLDAETFRSFSARPERLLELVRENRGNEIFIIDEIQEVPELLKAIHLLMEENKKTTFVLTGSSSRKLKRAGVDLLAGRALVRSMHPFMACELGDTFSLNTALETGLIPLIAASEIPGEKLKSYVAVYIQEEVKHEGLVRNIGDFARFLEIIAFSTGAELNSSNIARECGIGRKAVESYISILEDLLLAFTVPAFVKKAERSALSHPKFYFSDTGIFRSLRLAGPLDRPEEIGGAALESLVAQHLKAYLAYRNSDSRLYFRRTYADAEVDFIIYGKDLPFTAIEVKNTSRIRPEDLKGLRSFAKMYPSALQLILYRGKERLLIEKTHCIPVDTFLRNLHPSKSIDQMI